MLYVSGFSHYETTNNSFNTDRLFRWCSKSSVAQASVGEVFGYS